MRVKISYLCLGLSMAVGTSLAQKQPTAPGYSDIYCSGQVTVHKVPADTYLISGEQSNRKIVFAAGDYVYLNRGADQGAKAGDEFLIMREVSEPLKIPWSKWQTKLTAAMGTIYRDLGRIRIVNVHPKVSIAEVVSSCEYMQRGDIARPFEPRPVPPFKPIATFDKFAPASGKSVAMVVQMPDFAQESGNGSIVYVNLGGGQGVNVGDYFRVFRYQGTRAENIHQDTGLEYKVYGFGSTPAAYTWKDLPREVLGEGIVLRVGENASVVLLTFARREIFTGDYVEME